jgi:signal transduction histidine kinase
MYFIDLDEKTILIASSVGLIAMNKKNYTFSWYNPLQSVFQNKMTRQVLKRNQKLYVVSASSLYIFDTVNGEINKYNNFSSDPLKRATNATVIYMDSQNRLWVGVQGGISLIHEDLTFTYYPIEKNPIRPDGSYFMVLSIEEIDNKLWVGTFNSGLWQLDLSQLETPEDAIKRIDIPEFNTNTIYASIPDEENNVWISTNQGILKYEKASRTVTQFAVSEGIQDLEFNRLAYLKTRQKEIVFGGINGLNIFDPRKITTGYALVKPVILNVTGLHDSKKPFHINLRDKSSLKLSHDQNQISFNILVPNYQQPSTHITEYFLEDFDTNWTTTSTNTITYSTLKPGKYTFRIRTKFRGEITESDSIEVQINHPFWQTWWFITLSIVIIGLATYSGIKAYAAKTRRDKERLEQLLKERTAEIEKSREELEVLNQKKDLIFSILSHDLRSPLTTLKGFLSIIIENVEALPKEAIKKHAKSIRNSVSSSLDLIDNTLFWSMSQTGTITYTPSTFSLTETLQKIHSLYELTAEKKRINFELSVHEEINIYGDENMLYVALRNVVSNALKFTTEGKFVKIQATSNHQHAIIKITDEGIGMSRQYIEKLMADEQTALKVGTANEKGTGLGLILCKNFVQLNKGTLHIESYENTGTEFTIRLPLNLSDQTEGLK